LERERADRLANSAAGAALAKDVGHEETANTFVPGEGKSAEESFVTSFTKDQKDQIRDMVANASSPAEIEEIERSVKRGIFPATGKRALEAGGNGNSNKKIRV
jgi:hypothetical protein